MSKQTNTTPDRLPPHDAAAEAAALGCALMYSEDRIAMGELVEKVKHEEMFYDLRHQTLFKHLLKMYDANTGIDLVTVMGRLTVADELEKAGGAAYLSGLVDNVVSVAMLDTYIAVIRDNYFLRRQLAAAQHCISRIYEPDRDVAQIMDAVETEMLEVNQERIGARDLDWRTIMQRVVDEIEQYSRGHAQMRGLSTGIDYLDKMTAGMQPGQMLVLAARPGGGKTSLAFNIVEHVAVTLKVPVGVFSLEMTAEELGSRALFQRAKADFQRFRTGYLENNDLPKLLSAMGEMVNAPIYLDDTSGLTIMEIRAKARRWKVKHGIQFLVIDYLQLIGGSGRYRDREAEVAEISKGIKGLAKELKIPVLVLAQMNREFEKERNRKPRMSDLRESGAVEQDADAVLMLYEPKEHEEVQEAAEAKLLREHGADWSRRMSRVNAIIAKQRNGPTGDVELLFHKDCMKFEGWQRPSKYGGAMPSQDEMD